ncbi:MAG: hypothetical protein GY850_31225 [bacterium]|nr:hypothetical protein [bacterium]
METEVPEENQADTTIPNSDWDSRILCSDGSCIGVIGPDGLCKECGRKYEGELPEMSGSGEDEDAVADEVDTSADEMDSSATSTEILDDATATVDDGEWGNRVLCSDGNCIGVIGPDGKCKECGKPLE